MSRSRKPPILHPTASLTLPSRPYILSLTPHSSTTSSHLILHHPSPNLTIIDSESLQVAGSLSGGHTGDVSCVVTGGGASGGGAMNSGGGTGGEAVGKGDIWSAGKDATIIRWDERSRTVGQKIKAHNNGKALPLLSLAVSDNLLVGGSELVSSEAWLMYWDIRNPSKSIYAHSSTHSDDITFIKFLPSTSSFLPPSTGTPSPLLLSGSTDGLIALTNPKEEDEEEAFWGAEGGLEGSVAMGGGGAYLVDPSRKNSKGKGREGNVLGGGPGRKDLHVWARSDQNSLANFTLSRPPPNPSSSDESASSSPNDIEFASPSVFPTDIFKPLTHSLSSNRPVRSIRDEAPGEAAQQGLGRKSVEVDYIIDCVDTLGVNGRSGMAVVGAGSNTGDIVLLHHHVKSTDSDSVGTYQPSAFLMTPSSAGSLGHKDVVRCMYHDVRSNVLYSGSEDGVISGWNLPDPSEFITGDAEHDDDGGDGREDVESDDEDDEGDEDEMDVDDDDGDEEEMVRGKRKGEKRPGSEVWGGGSEGRKRRG